ncbi:unnamed protein product [Leptidea sinapis]|uniref:Uncharacterized protein n=1 Tax=Leptidea sinapis TaxID=189913 RepID=A0A5E4PRH3_9NEOP|nr:unnamed protein product [Leptidea sinapis]
MRKAAPPCWKRSCSRSRRRLEALKAAETSGQLLVFHTSLPTRRRTTSWVRAARRPACVLSCSFVITHTATWPPLIPTASVCAATFSAW